MGNGRTDPAVVIVYYSQPEQLRRTVSAALAQSPSLIVVVDNDSARPVPDDVRAKVIVLDVGENLGYAGAVNAGVEYVAGNGVADTVLVLTHETILEPGSVGQLMDAINDTPGLGLVAPTLLDASSSAGGVWSKGGTFSTTGRARHFGDSPLCERSADVKSYRTVKWVDGACMLFRVDTWREVGGLNPTYFLYFEEVDFCFRVRSAGLAVACVPSAIASQSASGVPTFLKFRNGWYFHSTWSAPYMRITWLLAELVRLAVRRPRSVWSALSGLRSGVRWRSLGKRGLSPDESSEYLLAKCGIKVEGVGSAPIGQGSN